MAGNTLAESEAAVANARRAYEQSQAEAEVASLIQELSERVAREEVIVSEDAHARAQRRVAATVGRVVLTDDALRCDVDLVKKAVARGEEILCDQRGATLEDFARRRLDRALSALRKSIKEAKPASEEKERLEHTLAALEGEYEIVVGRCEVLPEKFDSVIDRIREDNTVNEAWLLAQKEELAKLEMSRAPQQVRQPVYHLTR
jgi:archaellum component FlaC